MVWGVLGGVEMGLVYIMMYIKGQLGGIDNKR